MKFRYYITAQWIKIFGVNSILLKEYKEIANIFVEANEKKITDEQAKLVLEEFDKNGDGELSYEEYREFMKCFVEDEW